MNPPLPPIASPHGAGDIPFDEGTVDEVSIAYNSFSVWSVVRMTAKAMVLIPVCIILELLSLPALPLHFLVGTVINIMVLAPRGQVVTCLSPYGVSEQARYFSFSICWKRILWITNWGGDLFFCTIGGGCFIPREAFASREESREFATIARELKQGNTWRLEWNGRVFGLQSSSEEPGALSIPR